MPAYYRDEGFRDVKVIGVLERGDDRFAGHARRVHRSVCHSAHQHRHSLVHVNESELSSWTLVGHEQHLQGRIKKWKKLPLFVYISELFKAKEKPSSSETATPTVSRKERRGDNAPKASKVSFNIFLICRSFMVKATWDCKHFCCFIGSPTVSLQSLRLTYPSVRRSLRTRSTRLRVNRRIIHPQSPRWEKGRITFSVSHSLV
eukprot:766985-Hanusia_phi.AAC.3